MTLTKEELETLSKLADSRPVGAIVKVSSSRLFTESDMAEYRWASEWVEAANPDRIKRLVERVGELEAPEKAIEILEEKRKELGW